MQPNFTPRPDILNWSETRFLSMWSPGSGVGVFLHVGRLRGHIDWWWSQVAVYLPDGRTAVDRQWGRDTDPAGHRNGNLSWVSTQPDVQMDVSFDGVCEVVTHDELGTGPLGAGCPSTPISFGFTATARAPRWYMHGNPDQGPEWAGDSHTEQSFAVTGSMIIDGTSYSLDGAYCVDDHSSGVRQFDDFGGDDWLVTALPTGSMHSVAIRSADERIMAFSGARTDQGSSVKLRAVDFPEWTDLIQRERNIRLAVKQDDDVELSVELEILGVFVLTITQDNDNLNGACWDEDGDPIFFLECPVRLTMPDGEVAYGHIERSTRQHNVDRRSLRVERGAALVRT